MLKRIRRFWELTKKDPDVLKKFENLSSAQLSVIPDDGDGNAEFLGEGTDEELKEQERMDQGLDKWYKRILQ